MFWLDFKDTSNLIGFCGNKNKNLRLDILLQRAQKYLFVNHNKTFIYFFNLMMYLCVFVHVNSVLVEVRRGCQIP